MRIVIVCLLLTVPPLLPACKQQSRAHQASFQAYAYSNSAFSQNPGEAWGGDPEAMLGDVANAIAQGEYGRMETVGNPQGFAGRYTQATVLRPLKQSAPDGNTVYALETTACGASMDATPYEALRALFNKKYTTYLIARPE